MLRRSSEACEADGLGGEKGDWKKGEQSDYLSTQGRHDTHLASQKRQSEWRKTDLKDIKEVGATGARHNVAEGETGKTEDDATSGLGK